MDAMEFYKDWWYGPNLRLKNLGNWSSMDTEPNNSLCLIGLTPKKLTKLKIKYKYEKKDPTSIVISLN